MLRKGIKEASERPTNPCLFPLLKPRERSLWPQPNMSKKTDTQHYGTFVNQEEYSPVLPLGDVPMQSAATSKTRLFLLLCMLDLFPVMCLFCCLMKPFQPPKTPGVASRSKTSRPEEPNTAPGLTPCHAVPCGEATRLETT